MEAAVQVRIIDQAFPADGSARFFEIDSHDDLKVIGKMTTQFSKFLRIFFGSGRIMDGAGSDDDKKAVVLTVNDVVQSDVRCVPSKTRVVRKGIRE